MNWRDSLENNPFSITCGDGKSFTPVWIKGSQQKKYNTSIYHFIGASGSVVDRRHAQSHSLPLVFYFQGDDNIQQCNAFEASADHPSPWQVNHPFYGRLTGQPIAIKRDDTSYNVTKVTVQFWVAINRDLPQTSVGTTDRIQAKSVSVVNSAGIHYQNNARPTTAAIPKIQEQLTTVQSTFLPFVDSTTIAAFNAQYTTAMDGAGKLLADSNQFIAALQSAIAAPSNLNSSRSTIFSGYISAIKSLSTTLTTVFEKVFYETTVASMLATASTTIASIEPSEVVTRTEVNELSNALLVAHQDYVTTLDQNSVSVYGLEQAYNPNTGLQSELQELLLDTVVNLYDLAFNAKQERTVYTEKTTNLFALAHRYLGLTSDTVLEEFRALNKIKNRELFHIKKNREINYFV